MRAYFIKVLHWLKIALLIFIGSTIITVILYRFVPIPMTPLMLIRCAEQIWDGQKLKLKKDWEPIEKISPNLVIAVMASEDQRFMEHGGFDWNAIKKAMEHNTKVGGKKKKVVHGASTISQQVAKNVFLWPSRSWIRKGLEAYFTFLIELFWSKERIMEVYLNVIEMGPGIYGAEKASLIYFKKPASELTKDQASAIAAILPNPRKYNPVKPGPYVTKRKAWIKRNMSYLGRVKL